MLSALLGNSSGIRALCLASLVAVVVTSTLISSATAEVEELTPELAERFAEKRQTYLVKLDAITCESSPICAVMDQRFWEPLSNHPLLKHVPMTKVDCKTQPKLCKTVLATPSKLKEIETQKHMEFMAVSHSETNPTKVLVENYKHTNAAEMLTYFVDMVRDNLPFEASLPVEIPPPPFPKKVDLAVLVLTMDGFVRPDVWKDFSKTQTEKATVRIVMHNKRSANPSSKSNQLEDVVSVKPVFTDRMTISLVRTVIHMLRHAIAYGGASHYVLVSGDSVPLKSVEEIVTELNRLNVTRFEKHSQDFTRQYSFRLRKPFSDEKYLKKSKCWVSLTDEAARTFADPKNDHTFNFELLATADEYYWTNVADELGVPWTDDPVMHDDWPELKALRPNILKTVNSEDAVCRQHLFARKIETGTTLNLKWMNELRDKQKLQDEL